MLAESYSDLLYWNPVPKIKCERVNRRLLVYPIPKLKTMFICVIKTVIRKNKNKIVSKNNCILNKFKKMFMVLYKEMETNLMDIRRSIISYRWAEYAVKDNVERIINTRDRISQGTIKHLDDWKEALEKYEGNTKPYADKLKRLFELSNGNI